MPPVYLGDALGDDVIRERGELLLQLVEQLHDSDVRAVALPHRGPPSSWQGLPAGAVYVHCRYTLDERVVDVVGRSVSWSVGVSIRAINGRRRASSRKSLL